MNEETECDTWQRTDHFIKQLTRVSLRPFGSALTDQERAEGRAEINP